ncbi:polysaccharide pyruvyl transferase family protein [Cellulomonas telluris]|uniref:polysaccharide pyruvyl transferase family protein n=1 Tax=Cellulomonas telluris TaxID=2306636 RepID=UPI0010A7CA77|nr:polysaccharide pyruvyl transferase family protein [Cellulomonas telluris]
MTSVLLINSDLAENRGDRAIAEGNIQLVRELFPDATVTGISQHPRRDAEWYGIDFLDMDFQSLRPLDMVRLLRAARRSDLVLWGGGELLKDYTNKAALWYWALKMTAVSWANPRVVGAFQGIGPTASARSRRIIARLVNRTSLFLVRDEESRDKLLAWGADPGKVRAASDPAVLPEPEPLDAATLTTLREDFGIDEEFLADGFVCIGPRDWFHYRPGGILPFKYAERLPFRRRRGPDPRHQAYLDSLTALMGELTRRHALRVLLVPMHLSESDAALCRLLRDHSAAPDSVRILDADTLSPAQVRSLVARATAMIGFRLHSNIIGISAGVPCVNVYYVDKGRVFFDQIGQGHRAIPIEAALEEDFVPRVLSLFDDVLEHRDEVRGDVVAATTRLRASVRSSFSAVAALVGSGGSRP